MGRKSRLKRDDPERKKRVEAANFARLRLRLKRNAELLNKIFGPMPDDYVSWDEEAKP